MEIPEDFTLDDLDKIHIMTDYNPNRVAVRLGLMCSFYMKDTYNKEVRLRLAQCGDEYQSMFGEHLRYYIGLDGEGRPKKYPKNGIPMVEKIANNYPDELCFASNYSGSDLKDDASAYSLSIFSSDSKYIIGNAPAIFSATIPFAWLKDKSGEGAFQKLIHRWSQVLKPQHGYAGLGVIQSVEMAEKKRTSPLAYPLIKRFPGLDIDSPLIVSNKLGDGIKSVNWLTALDEDRLERLGGREAVLKQLDENFKIFHYEGGLLIQAGAMPQLGDVNKNHYPRYYRQLAQILAPLRMTFPENHSLFRPGNGKNSTEESNKWLARFDE